MRNLICLSAMALAVTSISSTAVAVQANPQPASTGAKTSDPNGVVCESQQDTGSRLASHRECKTRAEWAEERRLNRQEIEKVQTQRDLSH